ncbi:hypothetical protein ACFLIM_29580 [Nonomuraea sp. M3C6]|uniref:Uncharacterized protein n=1 Tax=Nonomuraea marmarensis TaxID=3351344 RepID=A0ABW7AJ22_9ACTN
MGVPHPGRRAADAVHDGRLAPVLLGPTPSERLAAAEEHARTLAERNRLARERTG